MSEKYPSDYEDVFNLILSLVEQVRSDIKDNTPIVAEELEDYFHRLSKGTIGEYEFMRRVAFENYPILKIAAFPILWKRFGQPIAPDFLVLIKRKLSCVEVKNYHWKVLIMLFILRINQIL